MRTRDVRGRSIVLAACLAMLGGCASWTPPLSADEKPSAQEAYLYGRFTMATGKSFLGLDGYGSIGFKFKCEDGSSYTIRFRIDGVVQLLRVKPSTCSLDQTIFTNGDGQIIGHKPNAAGLMKDLKLQAGTTYYLGDFLGSLHVTGGTMIHQEWRVESAKDEYRGAMVELKVRYPAFSDFPTQDAAFAWVR